MKKRMSLQEGERWRVREDEKEKRKKYVREMEVSRFQL